MQIPKLQSLSRELNQVQENIRQAVQPVLGNALVNGAFLPNVVVNGQTVVPHGLGRMNQGWFCTDIQGAATIYRSAAFSDQTLTLTSSGSVTVSLYVF